MQNFLGTLVIMLKYDNGIWQGIIYHAWANKWLVDSVISLWIYSWPSLLWGWIYIFRFANDLMMNTYRNVNEYLCQSFDYIISRMYLLIRQTNFGINNKKFFHNPWEIERKSIVYFANKSCLTSIMVFKKFDLLFVQSRILLA